MYRWSISRPGFYLAASVVCGLTLANLSCVTADKSKQSLSFSDAHFTAGRDISGYYSDFTSGSVHIRYFEVEGQGNLITKFFDNFIVDNKDAAISILIRNYIIVFAEFENREPYQVEIPISRLALRKGNRDILPVSLPELPGKISCINWKGNIKNAYNLSVIALTTVAVIAAISACVADGDSCDGLRHLDDVFRISTSGETKPESTFSDPVFTTQLVPNNALSQPTIQIAAHARLAGVLLYRRPASELKAENFINSLNCFVE